MPKYIYNEITFFGTVKMRQKSSWDDWEYILALNDQISVKWFIFKNVLLKGIYDLKVKVMILIQI